MAEQWKLSVVIATYNRAETLRETIRHITEQDLDPAEYELVIIDDGSLDNTSQVVEQVRARVPFKLTYLRHANHGPGYTQNRGLEVAAAPIVLLMADDIFMSPQALKAHLAAHEANPAPTVAVLGQVLQSPRLTQSVFLRKWDSFRFGSFAGQAELPYYRFWACNISVKREFVLGRGGFREHRGRGGAPSHEDPELGYRLHLAGMRLLYAPEALGYHYHLVTLDSACRRKYEAGLNFGQFREFVPEPEIAVSYHVLTRHTLRDHVRAWCSSRRQYLSPADRNPASALARYIMYNLIFNRVTIPMAWTPLARLAERNEDVAGLMRPVMYRGILFHHFLRGCRDGDRKFGVARGVGGRPAGDTRS